MNRVSTKDVFSPNNYPAANNAAFDGYAINYKETKWLNKKNKKKFLILRTIAAGDNPKISKIKKYSTVEIMTGGLIPKNFNTLTYAI